MAGCTGKREWAIELSTKSTTRGDTKRQSGLCEFTSTVSNVLTMTNESNIVDLFGIGAEEAEKGRKETQPFIHQVRFQGPQGEHMI
jgi:hypothetical protein